MDDLYHMDRWERLRKYAEWKMNKFRLCDLPDDVLRAVVSFLDTSDVHNLANAVCGTELDLAMKTHVDRVPDSMITPWTRGIVFHHFRTFLNSLAERALFYAFHIPHVCVFADWSPFSSSPFPLPLAEYSWRSNLCSANVVIHEQAMQRQVLSSVNKGSCVMHISMYGFLPSGTFHEYKRPLFTSHYMFAPPYVRSVLCVT